MNALQRLQETQETLQGVAARLRIDISDMTVPEQASTFVTAAIKLHDDLVTARTALADMERQRDEAREKLKKTTYALEREKRECVSMYRGICYLRDITLPAIERKAAEQVAEIRASNKRIVSSLRAALKSYEEADTKPRERVDSCRDILTPGIDGCSACLDRLQALNARAEKAEQELARMMLLRDEAREETASADRATAEREEMITRRDSEIAALTFELARFQRADVGEAVRRIEDIHKYETEEQQLWFERLHKHRGTLLDIVRQQAAEIERLTANMDRFRTDVGIEKAMHWGHRMRQERDEARAHLSAIGERVEKLKRWGCPEGRYMEPMHDGAYVALADVLATALEPKTEPVSTADELPRPIPGCKSALGPVVKDSLTTEPEQPLEKVEELEAKGTESLRRGLPSRAVIDALAAINGWWRYTVDTSGPMAVQLRYLGEELQCDFGDGHGWRNQPLTAPYERTAWRPQGMTWAELEALTNKAASEARP